MHHLGFLQGVCVHTYIYISFKECACTHTYTLMHKDAPQASAGIAAPATDQSLAAAAAMQQQQQQAAAAMQQQPQQQPRFVPEPPPWRKDPHVDYSTLMLLDLKCDVSKGEIRQIFKSVHCEFRGHGCTFHKTLREIIIPYKGLVLAYLCVYLYVYLSTTHYI
jgi:hypothetical protein